MSAEGSPRLGGSNEEKKIAEPIEDLRAADGSSLNGEDILALQDLDPALNLKMHLVNNVRDVLHWSTVTIPAHVID